MEVNMTEFLQFHSTHVRVRMRSYWFIRFNSHDWYLKADTGWERLPFSDTLEAENEYQECLKQL